MEEKEILTVRPPEYVINNFEFGKLYLGTLSVTNNLNFPIVFNVRSSDPDRIVITQKLIKLNSGQTTRVRFNVKINAKVNQIKNIFIRFFNELMDYKYYIHCNAKGIEKQECPKDSIEHIVTVSTMDNKNIEGEINPDENRLLTDNEHLRTKLEWFIERTRQLENLLEGYSKLAAHNENNFSNFSNEFENDNKCIDLKKQIIQIKYNNFIDNNIRFEEIINILQVIIRENSKIVNNNNVNGLSKIEGLIENFINGMKEKFTTNYEDEVNAYEKLETIEQRLDSMNNISKDLIDIRLVNERLIVENEALRNNRQDFNKNENFYIRKIESLENEINNMRLELESKDQFIQNHEGYLIAKDEEINKWKSCYEKSIYSKLYKQNVSKSDIPNYFEMENIILEKDNQIRLLNKNIEHLNNTINNLKKLVDKKPPEFFQINDPNYYFKQIENLKQELNKKDLLIAELCRNNYEELCKDRSMIRMT
jgi:hypothetical protein